MVTHLAAQITAKSAPKIAKCAFPKRETYNSSNLLLYKKDKKDNDHTELQHDIRTAGAQNMADSRSRRQELAEPEACAT